MGEQPREQRTPCLWCRRLGFWSTDRICPGCRTFDASIQRRRGYRSHGAIHTKRFPVPSRGDLPPGLRAVRGQDGSGRLAPHGGTRPAAGPMGRPEPPAPRDAA
jgi:hypothetical protein